MHGAKYVEQSKTFKARKSTVIKTIEDLLARGIEAGRFRADVDPIDLHLMISSFCFHRVAIAIRGARRSDAIRRGRARARAIAR